MILSFLKILGLSILEPEDEKIKILLFEKIFYFLNIVYVYGMDLVICMCATSSRNMLLLCNCNFFNNVGLQLVPVI